MFQDLQSAIWRSKRSNGVVPIWAWGHEDQESLWCSSCSVAVRLVTQDKPMLKFKSEGMKKLVHHFKCCQPEDVPSYSWEGQAFCSIQTFNCQYETHPHWGGQSALHSLPLQILRLSKNTFTNQTHQKNAGPSVWAPHGSVKLTNKINFQRCLVITWQGLKS